MRIIHFKNGEKKKISQEVAQHLHSQIINGCKQWQSFGDEKDQVYLMINLNEVIFID